MALTAQDAIASLNKLPLAQKIGVLVFIVGGMSGKLVLRGTHSGEAIAVFGIVLIALGVFRLSRR